MILLARTGSTSLDTGFLTLLGVLIGFFVLILFLIFLKKNTFPIINLVFIRIFKGKHSFEYLEFFKKNDLRNPLVNCIRDEITLHFSIFFKKLVNAPEYLSLIPIDFKEVPFFTSYKNIVRQFGTPYCINIARFDRKRVKVIGYPETFQEKKMKSLFYFIEDEFVMGEFVFSESRRIDPTSIREALSKKYLEGIDVTSDSFYITDPAGTILNYHDNGFFASVKYLYRGEERINEILNTVFTHAHQNGQAFRKAMIEEELLNRF